MAIENVEITANDDFREIMIRKNLNHFEFEKKPEDKGSKMK